MYENPVSHLKGLLAEKLSAVTTKKAFDKLPAGLVDLYINHYELLLSIKNIRQKTLKTEKYLLIPCKLVGNVFKD